MQESCCDLNKAVLGSQVQGGTSTWVRQRCGTVPVIICPQIHSLLDEPKHFDDKDAFKLLPGCAYVCILSCYYKVN